MVKRSGIVVRICPTMKNGAECFVCDYSVKGQRKLVWRASLADARKAADDAIDVIAEGQAERLELTNALQAIEAAVGEAGSEDRGRKAEGGLVRYRR